jgi:PEP-CTERM motif
MKARNVLGAVAAVTALLLPFAANATITYNETIPAVYGSGNPDTAWTADNENGVQIALRAQPRYIGGTYVPVGNVYSVPLGNLSSPDSGSIWGWAFSFSGLPTKATANLTITNVLTGQTNSFNPLLIGDNVTSGGYTQNSETLSYLVFAPGGTFDPLNSSYAYGSFDANALDTYNFTLKAFDSTGLQLASVSMSVVAGVPEPASLLLLGTGLLFLVIVSRRRSADSLLSQSTD